MKKILVLVVLFFFANSVVEAQTEVYGRKVRLGFKLDPVFLNNLKPKDNGLESDGSGFGFSYGLMADFMFRDGRGAFASGVEVTHASASLKYTDDSKGLYRTVAAGQDQFYNLKLQYLQIPLSIKLKTNPKNNMLFWGQFGTYFGALLGARMDYSFGSTSGDKTKIIKETTPINMGMLIGVGGEYHVADKTDIFFGLGFENGFVDVTKNNKWADGKVILNRWAIRLGTFF